MKRPTLLAIALTVVLCGCLQEPFTGSDVVVELGTGTFNSGDIVNRSSEHYEFFALINGGLVSVGKFRVDERLDAFTVPAGERIGVANQQSSSLPLGGMAFHTPAHLQDATEILLSIEDNEDTDAPPNGPIIATASLEIGKDGHPRGPIIGEVPTLSGALAPLVESQVTIIVSE